MTTLSIADQLTPYAPQDGTTDEPADLAWDGQDLVLSPAGDLAIVSGAPKARQDIVKLLSTTPGQTLDDPAYGNELAELLGEPMPSQQTLQAMAQHAAQAIQALQEARARAGQQIPLSEQVTGVALVSATKDPSTGQIAVVYRVAGPQQAIALTLAWGA